MSAKYTFLLPAYKAKYFDEALASIKNQTFKDFKVIVSDDCSPEDLKSVFDKVVGDDPRFEFRRNEVNMGGKSLVSHWNLLVDLCYTDYFIMASDDDIYANTFLEEIDRLLSKFKDVNLVRARVERINDCGKVIGKEFICDEFTEQAELIHFLAFDYSIHCLANYVFKTNAFKINGGFIDFPIAWFSDDATVIREANHGVVCTSNPLFKFRDSEINLSSAHNCHPSSSYNKVQACIWYIKWLDSFRKHMVESNDTEVNEQYFMMQKKRAYSLALPYLGNLSFVNFKLSYTFFNTQHLLVGTFIKFQIIKNWIKNHFK